MKIFMLLLSISLTVAGKIYSQKKLTLQVKQGDKEVLYLSMNEHNELEYFSAKEETERDSKKGVNAKENAINVYMQWINPVKYRMTWKDSTMVDERDQAIADFIELLRAPLVGDATTGDNQNKLVDQTKVDETKIQDREFRNANLAVWLLHIMENKNELEKNLNDVKLINEISLTLEDLDRLTTADVLASTIDIYKEVLAIDNISKYKTEFPKQVRRVEEIEGQGTGFGKVEEELKVLLDQIKSFKISNKLFMSFTKSTGLSYSDQTANFLKDGKKVVQKLRDVLKIIEESTHESLESKKYPGFYKMRSIEFDDGRQLETTLNISEYEFKTDINDFVKKKDVTAKTFRFQRYDPVKLSVSSGLFYASSSLRSFGVKSDPTGSFLVSEDTIRKNTAIPALFLNMQFGTSRYLAPLVQLGVDPTKKHPFLLAGVGLFIPSAKFALSGGPIWTWEQKLKNLKVGESTTSTTAVEKDIKYELNGKPVGWYFGLQYKF